MGSVSTSYLNKKINKVLTYAESLEKKIQKLEETLKEKKFCYFCGKLLDKTLGFFEWSIEESYNGIPILYFCYDCNNKTKVFSYLKSGIEIREEKGS